MRNKYWNGDQESNANGCGLNSKHKCNCDTYKMNVDDSGILSSTTKLPVMQLHYGGSVSKISRIIYKLDPLICSGKSGNYPSEATKAALEKRA